MENGEKVECLPDLPDKHSVADFCRTKSWKNSSGLVADFGNSVAVYGLTESFKVRFSPNNHF